MLLPWNTQNFLITFDDLGLAEPLLKAISAEGYTNPTPIQSKAIPVLLSGQDVTGIAQTGTGKTAAFVLPLLHRILVQKQKSAPRRCSALILSPTRELAAQIADNITSYARFTEISVALVVGGVRPAGQIKALKDGLDIVVATPGRLLDHMNNKALLLGDTHFVTLDEADQMLDMGFLPDIRRILQKLPKERQTALFSATMPSQIRTLTNEFQSNPLEIKVAVESRPIERIDQSVRHVEKSDKRRILTEILSHDDVGRAVVFTRTKRGADRVCKHLKSFSLLASVIHGNKSQGQRDRAIAEFRSGKSPILVATDIAARGIDVDDVSHVVNFELPNVPEAYVHRIGRTARAGRSGIAISLCDDSEKGLLRDIEKLIGNKLQTASPKSNRPGSDSPNESRPKARKIIQRQTRDNEVQRPSRSARTSSSSRRPRFEEPGPGNPSDGLMRMLSNIGVAAT